MTLKLQSLKADLDREHGGDWIPYKQPEWDEPIELRVRAFSYPPYQAARSALLQKALQRSQTGKEMDDDERRTENARLLCDHILLDWKNIDAPFSKQKAFEVLSDPAYRELLIAVESCAARVAQIKAEFLETTEKN